MCAAPPQRPSLLILAQAPPPRSMIMIAMRARPRVRAAQCADINTMPLLSAFDVYGGGINNVARCFAGTPYSGAYGPVLQTGVTSVGLAGHFHRSDQRGHGTMTLSEEVANELAAKLTHCHHVPVGAKKYATSPVQTRGIPHGFVPGVHSCLDDYVAALDTTLGAVHGNDVTVKGLFSMPFSGVTQVRTP